VSYILEALKKLERKRRREEGTRLLSEQQQTARPPKRWPLWPYLVSLALLLNAVLLLWWLHPWQQPQPDRSARQSRETMQEDSRPDASRTGEKGKDSGTASTAPSPGLSTPPAQERIAPGVPPPAATQDAERHPQGPQQHRKGEISPKQPAAGINELPPSLRLALPDLTISGHFFDARPSSRVVIIGGRTLHEGQMIAPGLKLEQITQGGAIFSYQGTRFRQTVF
jgi:hypothetical protein